MPIKDTGSASKYGQLTRIDEEKPKMLALPPPEDWSKRITARAVVALP